MINRNLLIFDFKKVFEKKKLAFIFFFCLILYPTFVHFVLEYDFKDETIISLFYQNIGGTEFINSVLEYSQLFLNVGFIMYISIYLFTLNVYVGREIFFLRTSFKKWFLSKMLSECMIISIISIIEIIGLIVLYIIYGMRIKFSLICFLCINKIVSNIILMCITIFSFLITKKYFALIVSVLYCLPVLFFKQHVFGIVSNILFCSNYCGFEFFLCILLVVIVIIFGKKKVYEIIGGI